VNESPVNESQAAASSRARERLLALVGAVVAVGTGLFYWGFTVDDALIPARYAVSLYRGLGYRASPGAPVTDGVTPLGLAHLLAPLSGGDVWRAFLAAKVLGLVAHTLGAAALFAAAARVARLEPGSRAPSPWVALCPLALTLASPALGAWSVAGLETGLVLGLAALAVALPRLGHPSAGALAAALVAALRPECLPLSLVIAALSEERASARRRLAHAALPLVAFTLVALTRLAFFGRAAPLSSLAKAPDAVLGARYALACLLLAGPVLVLAPLAFARATLPTRALVVATLVHLVAVALAGGDWMPLSRLVVPALPAAMLAAVGLAAHAPWAGLARAALAVAGSLFVLAVRGADARGVGPARARLSAELAPALAGRRGVATLDAGWVGASSEARVLDLAGVTDPTVAALPGGHTSRRVPRAWLDARGIDTLVLLVPDGEPVAERWTRTRFSRPAELYLAWQYDDDDDLGGFRVAARSTVPRLGYVVLVRELPRE
jgi:hypothetical protein